jgi:hypothetical protein
VANEKANRQGDTTEEEGVMEWEEKEMEQKDDE